VAKIFEDGEKNDKKGKIEAMIKNKPTDPTKNKEGILSLVWPEDLLYDKSTNQFVGYLMPYKDLEQNSNIRQYARQELDWTNKPPEKIYAIGYNLAAAVKNIHSQGHALGDMNHQNIFVNNSGYISLIDCDGFQIQGSTKTYRESLQFQRYAPPEGRGSTLEEVQLSDRFGLGVHIFQLLMNGFHPFQAKGSEAVVRGIRDMIVENEFVYGNPQPGKMEPHHLTPDYSKLPSDTRDFFSDCFSGGKNIYKTSRPTPSEWIDTFGDILGETESEPPRNSGGSTGENETRITGPDWFDEETTSGNNNNKSGSAHSKMSNDSNDSTDDAGKNEVNDPDDLF
jgi:DNA-binding helix-hairpin-helix protein with protein kinase domain